MATAKHGSRTRRRGWRLAALTVVVLCVAAASYWRDPLFGYSRAGAAYGAHTACSCRYIGGREIGDCRKDFVDGMQVVFLSEDDEERSVTARVPLLASETAHFSEGRGCLLDSWED